MFGVCHAEYKRIWISFCEKWSMSNKDKETERLEAEQSLYEHYWFDWYYGGRDRNALRTAVQKFTTEVAG